MQGSLTCRGLGPSGIEVTVLGFGAGPIGGFRGQIAEPEAQGILDAAWQAGVRYYDTSPVYGYGRSELRVGHALRQREREAFVVSTKVGRVLSRMAPGESVPGLRPGGLPFKPAFDYSRAGALRSLEQSYLRLGFDRIDILLIHDVDAVIHGSSAAAEARFAEAVAGAYPALADLRASGEIRALGVGLNEVDWCVRFVRETDLDCVLLAGHYTLLDQSALTELLPLCQRKGVGVILGAPYNSGLLARGPVPGATYDYREAPAAILEKVRRIVEVCARHDVPLQAAALQFPLAHPAVCSVIPGAMSRIEQEQNVAMVHRPIPAPFWEELRAEGLIDPSAPLPAST